jgi:pimeloyl-ACP methyl ester carboxylesterase
MRWWPTAGGSLPDDVSPTVFVLLHGGRHGGWCWQRVARRLRASGHEVYTPTLTGLGERSHLNGPHIGLDTHVEDLVSVFEYEDIEDAVLVAHSYGGIVATAAMEEIAERVRLMVYLDALMPHTGESLFSIIGPTAAQARIDRAATDGEGWYIAPTDASYWGVTDPDDIAWVNARVTSQPLKTYQDSVVSADRAWAHPATFIECRPSAMEPLTNPRERAKVDPRFHYHVLDAAHDVMITAPDELTALLLTSSTTMTPQNGARPSVS